MWAAWAEELKGKGITVNVLERGELTVAATSACWLLSDEPTHVTGQ